MNIFKSKVKSLIGKKTQTQDVAKGGKAEEPGTTSKDLVQVQQLSESSAVEEASASTA